MRRCTTAAVSLATGAVLALGLLAPAPALAAPASAQHGLRVGHSLGIGDRVASGNGRHLMIVRRNGSLERVDEHRVTWSSGTAVPKAQAAGTRLRLTRSGRLVLVRRSGHVAWRSARVDHARRLIISDSGRIELRTAHGAGVLVAAVTPVVPDPTPTDAPTIATTPDPQPSASTPPVVAVPVPTASAPVSAPVATPAPTVSAAPVPVPVVSVAPVVSDRLNPDQRLQANQSIRSADGRFALVMQTDGNLVLSGPSGVLWATNRQVGNGAFAVMQTDGNFVVYKPAGGAAWASGTGVGGSSLVLQSDGNLVVYAPGSRAVWSSGTVQGAAPTASSSNAVTAWADAQVGQTRASAADAAGFTTADWVGTNGSAPYGEWSGDCAKFAIAAWRHAGREIVHGNAVDIYNTYRSQGRVQGGTPPAGALVFWPSLTQWGHIAIADGTGGVYTTRGGDGDGKPVAHIPASSIGTPAGWTMPFAL